MSQQSKAFLLIFSRIFVGLLFIVSGLIKINDPIGFGYKLQEYFEVFKLYFLVDLSTIISLIICALEIVLGVALLLGIFARKIAWGLLILISFFTILTFSSAVFKIVSSCGCFGDAIPLTPWQSFAKDVILGIFIGIIFYYRKQIKPLITSERNALIICAVASIIPGIYTLSAEPIIDFLPYQIGANIPSLMVAPEGAPKDEYTITYHLKNKKNMEEKDVSDKEYLAKEIWKDTDWEIIGEPIQKLLKKGFDIKIKDLKIMNFESDVTEEMLHNPFPVFWIISYQVKENEVTTLAKLYLQFKELYQNKKIRFVWLTAQNPEEVRRLCPFLKDEEIYFVDAVPLKSMVRTQPGILLVKNGTIINKWNHLTLPNNQELTLFTSENVR